MNQFSNQVVLITGASSGIGKACATRLHERGYQVYGTSRSAPVSEAGKESTFQMPPFPYKMLRMDVNSDESVQDGVNAVLADAGRIDAAVNCAGFGIAGAVEDTSTEEAKAQLETNFFGTLRVCRTVLPTMREQGSGTIVNISSMAGLIGIPYQAMYSASKFAIEGMTEAMRLEVKPFGIKVCLVEPGDFSTGFTANRLRTRASQSHSAYDEMLERALKAMEHDETTGGPPDAVVQRIERILSKSNPRLRHPVGPLTELAAILLKRLIPHRLFEWAIAKNYRVG